MSNIFPSLTLESQLSISSSVSKSSITPWDSTFSLVASLSTFSVDLTMFFSTSWFALICLQQKIFSSVCTTLSNKFCVTSLTIPSSQTYSTIISVSSSLVQNASFFKIVNCLFRFRRLTPYSFIQTLIHGYKNFRRFSSGN